jgi:hypothetical protein
MLGKDEESVRGATPGRGRVTNLVMTKGFYEYDGLPVLGELPQAERAAQHAHVGVDADEHHAVDAARFQHVPDLDSRIADRVLVTDRETGVLALPRRLRVRPIAAASRAISAWSVASSTSPPSLSHRGAGADRQRRSRGLLSPARTAYPGPFHVDEAKKTLTHSMFVSLFPNRT